MFVPMWDTQLCTMGYIAADWIAANCCHGPGDVQGEPIIWDDDPEMEQFILEVYRIDPVTGRRVYDEGVLSRPKGRAKSEVAGWIVVFEAFGPARFDYWDENGQPVGKRVTSPLIKCLATEESQAGNTFENAAFIIGDWGQEERPEIYAGAGGVRKYQSATSIYLPHGGEIRACTSGAASKDGGKETFVVADETHLYVLPALKSMYATVGRNLSKRKIAQPWLLQTSTAFRPGEMSVFEDTWDQWKAKELSSTVYVNHREARGKIDLADKERTMRQLEYAYGDSAGWQDLEKKYRERYDTRYYEDLQQWVRYCLNRPESGDDVWIAKDIVERQTLRGTDAVVALQEWIAVGFDGSLNDDATALIGCRMSDGLLFPLGIWAPPRNPREALHWQVPRLEVMARIREVFDQYRVARMYGDPHEWRSDLRLLAEEQGEETVLEWPTSSYPAMHAALDRLRSDFLVGGQDAAGQPIGRAFHNGDPTLMAHFVNMYVERRGRLRLVRKQNPRSPRKIDGGVGATLAYEARADAIADGWTPDPEMPAVFFGM